MGKRVFVEPRKTDEPIVTKETFRQAFPKIFDEIFQEGYETGLKAGKFRKGFEGDLKTKLEPGEKPEDGDREKRKGTLIREYQEKHRVSLKDAVLAVGKEHPELFR